MGCIARMGILAEGDVAVERSIILLGLVHVDTTLIPAHMDEMRWSITGIIMGRGSSGSLCE